MKFSHTPVCRRKPLTCHRVDDEVLLYDADAGATHRLNRTAYTIWRSCDGRRTGDAIAARLGRVWDVDSAQARTDVHRAIRQMLRHGLIERVR